MAWMWGGANEDAGFGRGVGRKGARGSGSLTGLIGDGV